MITFQLNCMLLSKFDLKHPKEVLFKLFKKLQNSWESENFLFIARFELIECCGNVYLPTEL